ncbi:Zn(II)2Cys6 transcription factor, partial [Aspergillus aculeatinus CBS 121060]
KHIRQACSNCRRRKTKCTGERPVCFQCRRNKHTCVYEPYSGSYDNLHPPSATAGTPTSENVQLSQRISILEQRLAELSEQTILQPGANSVITSRPLGDHAQSQRPIDLSQPPATAAAAAAGERPYCMPPQSVLDSTVDAYFIHVHNQPYSNVQEASFRRTLEDRSLPNCLILALLAAAVRFSTHDFYRSRQREMSEVYTREAWLSVLMNHLNEDSIDIKTVQTINILAVIDFTAGRTNSGWLKTGLAARISQGLGLMVEPEEWRLPAEQEERRRVFWSVYLLDKLISCGRARPLIILDQDCHIQLPCDERSFRHGQTKKTCNLNQLLSWNTTLQDTPSSLALVILLASILGRCTRYVYGVRHSDEIPPWDTKSEYAAVCSLLLLFEHYAELSPVQVTDLASGRDGIMGDPYKYQELGHLIFAHTLFHLCHCLLNHPFILCQSLRPLKSKVPGSFAAQGMKAGIGHAVRLINLLQDVLNAGGPVQSSFYAYCLVVAGGILSIASHETTQSPKPQSSEMLECFQSGLHMIDGLASLWPHASHMVCLSLRSEAFWLRHKLLHPVTDHTTMTQSLRLRNLHEQRHNLDSLLDTTGRTQDIDPLCEATFWSILDYSIVSSDPKKDVDASGSELPSMPSPMSWALGFDMFAAVASSRIQTPHEDFSSGAFTWHGSDQSQ